MQHSFKKHAMLLLLVALAMIVGCSGRAYTPDYRQYEYNPQLRYTSDFPMEIPNPTQIVDEIAVDVNDNLVSGKPIAEMPLIELEFEANTIEPWKYSYYSGNVFTRADSSPRTCLYSTASNVTFAAYNFNYLQPSQFISYVEVIGDGDFLNRNDEGFFFGMRQGGEDKFSWSGPAGGNENWIFTYSLHESQDYQGGIPSFVIAVADGDRLRIEGLRVVVSNVDDHLRRPNKLDPHRVWPFIANEYYNPGKVHHYYNGVYHRDDRDGNYWNDDFNPRYRNPYDPHMDDRNKNYYDRKLDTAYDDLNYSRDEVRDLQEQLWDLEQIIKENHDPVPVPEPPVYYAPGYAPKNTSPSE